MRTKFLHGLVATVFVVAAVAAGCGSTGAPAADVHGPVDADGPTESISRWEGGTTSDSASAEGETSIDSAFVSNDDGDVDSGWSDSRADSSQRDSTSDASKDADAQSSLPTEDAGADVSASFFVRYEAESSLNKLAYPVEGVVTDGARPCPGTPGTSTDGVKEGANCNSGGHVVNQILGRSPCTPPTSATSYTACGNKGGGVTFNEVLVPADGIYDVTFWYHSGQLTPGHADTYGDTNCGGHNYNTGPGSGCRPHLIYVNGVQMSSTVGGQNAVYYEFPAYPDSWSIVHGAVTALPLKAGSNTIDIKAPGFTTSDAADIDALDVQPSGPGAPSFQASGSGGPPTLPIGLVTPVVNWN
jgi:hypothetical protein